MDYKFKVGDKVKLPTAEELGKFLGDNKGVFSGYFVNDMWQFCGKEGVIAEATELAIKYPVPYYLVAIEGVERFSFRYWDERVLTLIEPPKPINLAPENKAIVESITQFTFRGNKTTCYVRHDNIEAIGTARCNPEDAWDEKVGRRLALQRAMEKMIPHPFKELVDDFKEGLSRDA